MRTLLLRTLCLALHVRARINRPVLLAVLSLKFIGCVLCIWTKQIWKKLEFVFLLKNWSPYWFEFDLNHMQTPIVNTSKPLDTLRWSFVLRALAPNCHITLHYRRSRVHESGESFEKLEVHLIHKKLYFTFGQNWLEHMLHCWSISW